MLSVVLGLKACTAMPSLSFFPLKRFICFLDFMCMKYYLYVFMCTTCLPASLRGWERLPESLKLEL